MRFLNLVAAASTALIATVGIAAGPTEQRFTRDGRTYVYTRTLRQDGQTLLVGRELDSNARFRLLVKGDQVTGYSNGQPVRFRAAQPLLPVMVAASN